MEEKNNIIVAPVCAVESFAKMENYPDDICLVCVSGNKEKLEVEVDLSAYIDFDKMESFLSEQCENCKKNAGSTDEVSEIVRSIISLRSKNHSSVLICAQRN